MMAVVCHIAVGNVALLLLLKKGRRSQMAHMVVPRLTSFICCWLIHH